MHHPPPHPLDPHTTQNSLGSSSFPQLTHELTTQRSISGSAVPPSLLSGPSSNSMFASSLSGNAALSTSLEASDGSSQDFLMGTLTGDGLSRLVCPYCGKISRGRGQKSSSGGGQDTFSTRAVLAVQPSQSQQSSQASDEITEPLCVSLNPQHRARWCSGAAFSMVKQGKIMNIIPVYKTSWNKIFQGSNQKPGSGKRIQESMQSSKAPSGLQGKKKQEEEAHTDILTTVIIIKYTHSITITTTHIITLTISRIKDVLTTNTTATITTTNTYHRNITRSSITKNHHFITITTTTPTTITAAPHIRNTHTTTQNTTTTTASITTMHTSRTRAEGTLSLH
ncbi:hypothetical protein O3P69_006003 [Scylla paramamosain]|uniref:Uncharacterized protein n=1 Tax=Scylla paramamosain TaxID=85552 RepID=A0AAW0U6J9_SCYPA